MDSFHYQRQTKFTFMRKIIICILCFSWSFSVAQFQEIKNQIAEVFFQIPVNSTRFEIRNILYSSDNFYNRIHWDEIGHTISSDFVYNSKLSYLCKPCKFDPEVTFFFKGNNEHSHERSIKLMYSSDQLAKCIKQYGEIVSFFKNIAFWSEDTVENYKGVKIGIRTVFFASKKAIFDERQAYEKFLKDKTDSHLTYCFFRVSYIERDLYHVIPNPPTDRIVYVLSIDAFENAIY